MSTMLRIGLWVLCGALLAAPKAAAQTTEDVTPGGSPPPHVSFVGGQAFIDREGQSEPAEAGMALLDGDRLRTEEGHLDAVLSDGSLLHLHSFTTVDLVSTGLVRFVRGGVVVTVREPDRAIPFRMDASLASIQSGEAGEFGVTSTEGDRGTEVVVAVFQGSAFVANDLGAEDVSAGETAVVREGLAPSRPEGFDSTRWDGTDTSGAQRGDDADTTASADALPPEPGIDPGAFDQDDASRDDQNDNPVVYLSVVSVVPGFGHGPGRPGAGARGDGARRPPGVMAFSNRRSGSIERVDPREILHARGPWDAVTQPGTPSSASRSASPRRDRSLSRAPARQYSYPRSSGDAVDTSPRSAYGRRSGGGVDDSQGPASGRRNSGDVDNSPRAAPPRSYGLPSTSPMRQHADPRGAGGVSLGSPRRDTPGRDASPPGSPSGSSARPREPGRGIPSGGLAPTLAQPDSSSHPPSPRYNPGSGGSRPSAGGLSSAGPRGGRGRTPD